MWCAGGRAERGVGRRFGDWYARMIVVVNNETHVREGLRRALAGAGYEVRAFARGVDALEEVAWSGVELVITDRTNSPMDGVAFVRRVRERANVPVVFVSAWAAELEEELRGTELAADDYIQTPFSLSDVAARVESVLQGRVAPRL